MDDADRILEAAQALRSAETAMRNALASAYPAEARVRVRLNARQTRLSSAVVIDHMSDGFVLVRLDSARRLKRVHWRHVEATHA